MISLISENKCLYVGVTRKMEKNAKNNNVVVRVLTVTSEGVLIVRVSTGLPLAVCIN